MGEPVDPTTQSPPSKPTPARSLLLSEKALEATRTEILVIASGILFLASPVFLLVWILCRAGTSPATFENKEERKVSIILPTETEPSAPATDDAHDDRDNTTGDNTSNANEESLFRLRRSSTWGGRSAQTGPRPRGRRKSAGSRRMMHDSDEDGIEELEGETQGAQTSLSSPGLGPEPQPEIGHAALAASGGMGRVAAALATPATVLLPFGDREEGVVKEDGGGVNKEGDEATELREFDPRRGSIEKPPSPRSPRVLAADQAAMMDALCAEDGEGGDWKAAVPSPVGVVGRDSLDLASGFDDPLRANKVVGLPAKNEKESPEEVELETREA